MKNCCTLCGRVMLGITSDEPASHMSCRLKQNDDDALRAEGSAEAIARVVAMMRGDARRFMGTRHHAAYGAISNLADRIEAEQGAHLAGAKKEDGR